MVSLSNFRDILLATSELTIRADVTLNGRLELSRENALSMTYAPFEYIAPKARVVFLGITPGKQQAANALCEARRQILAGQSDEAALKAAKSYASFSGAMRSNLVAMLDFLGLHKRLGIDSVSGLWSGGNSLAHFTSALRYPVFLDGQNYSGAPSIERTPFLVRMVETFLLQEVQQLSAAVWIPLGPAAEAALMHLVGKGALRKSQVVRGLPHPSGANAERIAYFLGRKDVSLLSPKTSANKIDANRARLLRQVAELTFQ